MPDNSNDFNKYAHEPSEALERVDLSTEELMAHLDSLPDNGLMSSVAHAVNERMIRMLMLTDISAHVSALLSDIGFDPDDFCVEEDSLDRYLNLNTIDAFEKPWNGPYYDWEATDETTVRVVTTVLEGDETDEGTPVSLSMDIYKIDDDDRNWKRYSDGDWLDDGPPANAFDLVEEFWDFLDEGGEWDEWEGDEDDDDWDDEDDDDDDIFNLPLRPAVYEALTEVGIESIEQLRAMSDDELLSLPGIGRKKLANIRQALAEWDDEDDEDD